jgi:flagellar basal body-associated protein FliL
MTEKKENKLSKWLVITIVVVFILALALAVYLLAFSNNWSSKDETSIKNAAQNMLNDGIHQ